MKKIFRYFLGSHIFSEELIEAIEVFKDSNKDNGKMLLRRLHSHRPWSIGGMKMYILKEKALNRILDKYTLMPEEKLKRIITEDDIPSVNMPMFRFEYLNPYEKDAIAYIDSAEFIKDKRSKNRYKMFAYIIILNSDVIKNEADLDKYNIYPRVTLAESNSRVIDDVYGFDIELKNTGEVK